MAKLPEDSKVRLLVLSEALLKFARAYEMPLNLAEETTGKLELAGGDLGGKPLGGGPVSGAAPHVPAPGQTIAEGAKAATGGAGGGAWAHGFGHNAHVRTPQGAKLFHEPIGALIVPHAHPHIQNEHGAEHLVSGGSHKYVQAGEHAYAVHKDADVHVPKDTDIHDEGQVAHATKVVVGKHHGQESHAVIGPDDNGKQPSIHPLGEEHKTALAKDWKKLPAWGGKKPVSLQGKHAGWVPHDWKVYKAAGVPEDKIGGKFAKAPDGSWYHVHGAGEPSPLNEKNAALTEKWASEGKLEEEKPGEGPGHPELHAVPHAPKEGAEAAKVNIGGVHVTHAEVQSAISHLEAAKSTNVKGPLKSKGHPLAAMDYMDVSKKELAKYPHLKVPPGSKQQHVGQVKLAVLHHLHRKAGELAHTHAEQKASEEGVQGAESAAAHAQQLTPSVAEFPKHAEEPVPEPETPAEAVADLPQEVQQEVKDEEPELKPEQPSPEAPPAAPVGVVKSPAEPQSWGGVQVTTDQLQQAAQWLQETSTGPSAKAGFKGAMKKFGNPMADADYMGVAAAWKKANPEKAKGLNTKQLMLAHVNELLAAMTKADEEKGHPQSAELHQLIDTQLTKADWHKSEDGGVTRALRVAHNTQKPAYANYHPGAGWSVTHSKPYANSTFYYVASPDHSLVKHEGSVTYQIPEKDVLEVVKQWSTPKPETPKPAQVKVPEAPKVVKAENPKPTSHAELTKELLSPKPPVTEQGITHYPDQPEHGEIAKILKAASLGDVKAATANKKYNANASIIQALWFSANANQARYVVAEEDANGGYATTWHAPKPGSFAAQTPVGYYKVLPNHVVVFVQPDGSESAWPGHSVLTAVQDTLGSPLEPLEEEHAPSTIGVWVDGEKVADVPEGSKIYTGGLATDPATAVKFVKFPDGSWHQYLTKNLAGKAGQHSVMDTANAEHMLSDQVSGLKPVTGPEAEGKTKFTQDGHEFWAEPGATAWKDSDYPNAGTYFRSQDGTWTWWSGGTAKPEAIGDNGDAPDLDQGVKEGGLVPHGKAAESYASAIGAGKKNVKPDPGTPQPAAEKTGQPVVIDGKEVGQVPSDAKVYWYSGTKTSYGVSEDKSTKYVKYADGHWQVFAKGADKPSPGTPSGYDSYIGSGFTEVGQKPEFPTVPSEEVTPATPKAEETPAAGVPAVYTSGSIKTVVGEFPPGSQLYKNAKSTWDTAVYAKAPDGTWYKASSASVYKSGSYDTSFESGGFVPVAPPTEEEIQHIKEVSSLKEKLKTSSVDPGKASSWQQAAAQGLAKVKADDVVVVFKDGTYRPIIFAPSGQEYWIVHHGDLSAEHVQADGTKESIPLSDVSQLLNDHLVPNSALVGGKVHKFGFYYKQKGKAYLEVKAGKGSWDYSDGAAGKANYIWHDVKGNSKSVTPTFAAKFLTEGGDQYHELPKQLTEDLGTLKKVSYASVEKPGSYGIWGTNGKVIDGQSAEIHPDGSHTLQANGMTIPMPNDEKGEAAWDSLLGAGKDKVGYLLDQHGTSVVKPGLQPEHYVVFGHQLSKGEVEKLLADMTAGYDGGWQVPLATAIPFKSNPDIKKYINGFFNDKLDGKMTGAGQRDSVMGLLRELLAVPLQPSGTQLAGVEAKYLKGLPPGINSPKDVFGWTDQGYAKPFSGAGFGDPNSMDSTQLSDKIKAVSADFGDGKVVGTHPSALTKGQKVQWLQAWKSGNMAAVFHLDAQSGKVSPVHPGAPANTVTHQVTWAPWDPSQVPASKKIEGDWTPLDSGVTLPKAEVGNYLIKAGLQHPEYLTDSERRQWVIAHRNGNQEAVDTLSRIATQKWEQGGPQLSVPPVWTDNIKPANSYDSYLEQGTPALSWSSQAQGDFVKAHPEELAPFKAKIAEENGYEPDDLPSYYNNEIIQSYLDDQKAQQIAAQSVPVWAKTPGAPAPKGSHPIYQLTQTIPYTGKTSEWLFKPAPDNEKFLADQEDAAGKLANAWGFLTPASQTLEHDGKYGQAQHKLPAVGDLSYGKPLGFYDVAPIDWGKFTQRQVSDVAREHLLDWALDNDDGRASNFLRMPDGSIVGIDKGRSWIDFGHWKGLSGNHEADERSAQVSTQLYNAIRTHDISKEVADKAYIDTIQRARRMESLPDSRMTQLLEQAFAGRTTFGTPGSRQKLIQAVVDRKNSLSSDFEKLWAGVYKDAGWQLPEVPINKLPVLPDGTQLHSGFSEPGFLEHVHSVGSHGIPAFFGGHGELAGNNFIVWKEYEGAGSDNPLWWGESMAKGSSYDKLISWVKQHENAGSTYSPGEYYISKASGFYSKIIAAGKTVSHHASDKKFNAEKMAEFQAVTDQLKEHQQEAEKEIQSGSGKHVLGVPAEVALSMANHYLDLADRVNKAKDTGGTFKPGDLPDWKPPVKQAEEKVSSPVKVQVGMPYRPHGISHHKDGYPQMLSPEDGQLHTSTDGHANGESTKVWRITLPTGEEIELSDGTDHGVQLAHHGRIRFRTREGDTASFERIRSQLQDMGMNLNEAELHDMELYYWRHLAEELADRADGNEGEHTQVWNTLHERMGDHGIKPNGTFGAAAQNVQKLADAHLSPDQELAIWHEAWAHISTPERVAEWSEKQGYLPKFGHFDTKNPAKKAGMPYWYRFDVTKDKIAKWKVFQHAFQNDAHADPMHLVRSGGLYSKEERYRALGLDVSGMSNPANTGATAFIYTRLHHTDGHVLFSPLALARTTNYAWNEDNYGKVHLKSKLAYFDPDKMTSFHGGANETMVANTLTFLDDVELLRAYNAKQRDQIIKELKEVGITHVRGLPVEQRIVTNFGSAELAVIAQNYKEHPELLDPLIEMGLDSELGLSGRRLI